MARNAVVNFRLCLAWPVPGFVGHVSLISPCLIKNNSQAASCMIPSMHPTRIASFCRVCATREGDGRLVLTPKPRWTKRPSEIMITGLSRKADFRLEFQTTLADVPSPGISLDFNQEPRVQDLGIAPPRQRSTTSFRMECSLGESRIDTHAGQDKNGIPRSFFEKTNSDDQRERECNFRRSPSSSTTTNDRRKHQHHHHHRPWQKRACRTALCGLHMKGRPDRCSLTLKEHCLITVNEIAVGS